MKPGGSRSWLFIYRAGRKQREMGLGSLERVPLAKARVLARDAREALGAGQDPIQETRRPKVETFGQRAEAYLKIHKPGWSNPKHVAQWEASLHVQAVLLKDIPVNQITSADVVKVLDPIWMTTPETGSRTRLHPWNPTPLRLRTNR